MVKNDIQGGRKPHKIIIQLQNEQEIISFFQF